MDKKIIIAGAVVGIVGFGFYAYSKAKATGQESVDAGTTGVSGSDSAYYSGLSPVSGGYSSVNSGGDPSNPGNSGTTDTGGGFSLDSLYGSIIDSFSKNQALSIISGEHVADSSILAGIIGKNGASNVTVTHGADGSTNINTGQSPTEQIIQQKYQTYLGRSADQSGLAFYQNAILNGNTTIAQLDTFFKSSPEYLAKQQAANAESHPTPGVGSNGKTTTVLPNGRVVMH